MPTWLTVISRALVLRWVQQKEFEGGKRLWNIPCFILFVVCEEQEHKRSVLVQKVRSFISSTITLKKLQEYSLVIELRKANDKWNLKIAYVKFLFCAFTFRVYPQSFRNMVFRRLACVRVFLLLNKPCILITNYFPN